MDALKTLRYELSNEQAQLARLENDLENSLGMADLKRRQIEETKQSIASLEASISFLAEKLGAQ